MLRVRSHAALLSALGLLLAGCAAEEATVPPLTAHAGAGVSASATGGGHYNIADVFNVQFSLSAVVHSDGSVSGRFHHSVPLGGNHVEFHGALTCLTVDAVNGRAWIGGVITNNKSTAPGFIGPIFEPGKDIWFRVLDTGAGSAEPDRTTFVGFEGSAGIITSQEYCDTAIWPDGNARTWPVTGNITVQP